jgi:hypothetical protein
MKFRIKQRHSHFQNSLAGVCGILLMLCAVQVGLTQQSAPAKPAAVAENAPGAAGKTGDEGGKEGIKVHGHWTIDVKNPDGTLAQHHEFENSLQLEGAATIIQLITGIDVPSDMGIGVTSPAGQTPPCGVSQQNICLMVRSLKDEPGTSFCISLAQCSVNLTSAINLASQPYSLTYSGSFQASFAGSITGVESVLGTCNLTPAISAETTSPAGCTAETGFPPAGSTTGFAYFSATTISAVAVTTGQIVQVSVAFTFS